MKNNKGMTMIEVVVVMALIAIVTSGTVLSVSSLRRARVKKQFDVLQSQTINLRENIILLFSKWNGVSLQVMQP